MTPDFRSVYNALFSWLLAETGIPGYRHATPSTVDEKQPWWVLQYVPGGGPSGSALRRNRRWVHTVQTVAAARDPNRSGDPTVAVYDAALWAAQTVRDVLLAQSTLTVIDAESVAHQAGFGADQEGDVVNVTDRWVIEIASCIP